MRKIFGLIGALALGVALLAAPSMTRAADISLDGNLIGQCGTTTAGGNGTAATATLANKCGVITTEALTAPTSSLYTLTLTNTVATSNDILLWSVTNGTNTTGQSTNGQATISTGTVVFNVRHLTATSFNGTLHVRYMLVKATGN